MLAEYGITKGSVLKYTLLPGILPRIGAFTGSSFSRLAYLIALVYNCLRILPDNHLYLKPESFGKYGIRHVLAEAANNIKPSWKNIDQVIVFLAVLAAMVMMSLQFLLLLIGIFITQAKAAMPTSYGEFFTTPNPNTDIAYRLLDLVFGVPGLFNSQETVNTSLHQALHALFEFYSYGMLIVGFFIIIYYVATVVAETAQSGTPFGQRFNHVWAPIRMVVFFALLIPVNSGLNGGQMITLAAAKFGSSLATNGWLKFTETLETATYLGDGEDLVATPNAPEFQHVAAFLMIAKTCSWAEGRRFSRDIDAYIVSGGGEASLMSSLTFQEITTETNGADVHIIFGEKNAAAYGDLPGGVYPYCGELVLRTSDISEPGPAVIQNGYYTLVQQLWVGTGGNLITPEDIREGTYTDIQQSGLQFDIFGKAYSMRYMSVFPRDTGTNPTVYLPPNRFKESWVDRIRAYFEGDGGENAGLIAEAVEAQAATGNWLIEPELMNLGWGGAGIWYNKIAQQNGALTTAIFNTPVVLLYPEVMEYVQKEKMQYDGHVAENERFTPTLASGQAIEFQYPGQDDVARALHKVYEYWQQGDYRNDPEAVQLTGNIFIDSINAVFGTTGLFDMCKNTDIHPLAQLSAVGKSAIESSIQAMGMSVGTFAVGGALKVLSEHLGAAGIAAAGFFGTIASIGLLIGFILFYVIPFLPFIYFFFAVGGWVKGIFEAMVGMPLWALAHLRIDGEGLPGDAGMNGYWLIFEIFIRPILIVFGLLASIAIFGAMVKVLNDIFYLVITNLAGHDPSQAGTSCFTDLSGDTTMSDGEMGRGAVDEFFFTLIYTIIVYMIGMSCFKLIDLVPNHILRWLGANVQTFNDQAGEPADGLVKYAAIGGQRIGSELKGSIGGISGLFGNH